MQQTLILLVEHRHCENCKREHVVPNLTPHVRVPAHPYKGATKLVSFHEVFGSASVPREYPRTVEHIHTNSICCHHCFFSFAPEGQQELFIEAKVQRKRKKAEPSDDQGSPKPIRPLALSDF